MAKVVYKININGDPHWVHASSRGNTVKLRWFGHEYQRPEVLDLLIPRDLARWNEIYHVGQKFEIGEIAGLTNDVLPFSADKLRVDEDSDKWVQVFDRLRQLGQVTPVNEDAPVAQQPGVRSPIPLTRIRRFYETMRMLNEARLQGNIAQYLTERNRADRIQVMFKESEAHFARYANPDEPFHERIQPDWLQDYAGQREVFAKCLVARLHPNAAYDPVAIEDGK